MENSKNRNDSNDGFPYKFRDNIGAVADLPLRYGWPYYYNESPYSVYETFGPQPFKTDAQIKKSIEGRFFWSPFVDRSDVKVTMDGGVATLTGTVGTWIGYGEAEKDARNGGATAVLNHVTVNQGHWL